MSLAKVMACFDKRIDVPIRVNEVRDVVMGFTTLECIKFYGVKSNPIVYRGQMDHYSCQNSVYGSVEETVDITYSLNMSQSETRLVICKELLHILDEAPFMASSRKAVSTLISQIVIDPKFAVVVGKSFKHTPPTIWDSLLHALAAGVLIPYAAREELMPAYKSGALTVQNISDLTLVPPSEVSFVMSDFWPDIRETINDFDRSK